MALSHLALGDTLVADRLPSAVAAWLTGLVIAVLAWRIGRAGRWSTVAGIAAAMLWWALPFSPGRTATLESVMALCVVASQLAWVHAIARRDPRWLLVGGALAGLAAACKLTGGVALIALLPATALLLRPKGDRPVLPFALGALAVAALAWLFPFVPMDGDALAAMSTPVTFQLEHAEVGHTVVVAGESYQHAPLWSSLRFFVDKVGPWAAGGLTLAALLGWGRHGWRVAPVGVTLVGFVIALSLSPVQLPHYQYVWWPLALVLAGSALAPSRASTSTVRAAAATVAAAVALLPVAGLGIDHVDDVAGSRPSGLVLAQDVVAAEVPEGTALTIWTDPWSTKVALPDRLVTTKMPGSLAPRALLVDPVRARRSDATDLALWRDCRTVPYAEHRVGELILFVRLADPRPGERLDPWCGPLLTP